jgi:hypothetical protein
MTFLFLVKLFKINLNLVLTDLGETNLILNMKKCLFAADEVTNLGPIVKADGIRLNPEKISFLERMVNEEKK